MTQHLLNGSQIGAVFQQVYGKGMAQGVGGDILLNARFFLIVLDDLPKALATHAFAAHIHKQRMLFLIGDEPGTNIPHIVLQRLHRSGVQRHDALLSLAAAADKAGGQIDIADIQTDQLTDSNSGGIQQLQHSVVTESLFVHAFGLLQKQLYLPVGEDLRILPLHLHGHHALGRVALHSAALHHIGIK